MRPFPRNVQNIEKIDEWLSGVGEGRVWETWRVTWRVTELHFG